MPVSASATISDPKGMLMRRSLLSLAIGVAACKSGPAGVVAAPPTAPMPPTVAAPAPAPPPKALELLSSVEGVSEYQLANGLRILLVPDESQPKTTVNIVYRVGSRQEGYGETGMAHLLEHMNFKGTPKHPDVWQEFRDRGFLFNASTDYDGTEYHETFTASDENLDYALALEAD